MGFIFRAIGETDKRHRSQARKRPPVAGKVKEKPPQVPSGEIFIEGITLLFGDGYKFNVETIKSLASKNGLGAGFVLDSNAPTSNNDQFIGIKVGSSNFSMLFMDMPAPGVDEMVQTTRSEKKSLAPLVSHKSHCLLLNLEKSVISKSDFGKLLNVLSDILSSHGLGIILTDSWQCLTLETLEKWKSQESLDQIFDNKLDKMIFCNLIPFHAENGTWWATKGNHCFGIPDFALWVDGNALSGQEVGNVLYSVFDYIRGGVEIKFGQTIGMGEAHLVAGPVTEYKEYISGKYETIAFKVQ